MAGYRLFFMLRRFPLESKGRQNKLQEVQLEPEIIPGGNHMIIAIH
jgi:hypothetical protein